MEPAPLELLQSILETPRPSGYEEQVQHVVQRYAQSFCDRVHLDVHGNLLCEKNSQAPLRLMLAIRLG